MTRFAQFIERLADHDALVCMECDGRVYSYRELLAAVDRWQQELDRQAIAAGEVVAICADYSLGAAAVLLALFARGSVAALIPAGGDREQYLADSQASALLELDGSLPHHWTRRQPPAGHPLLARLKASGDAGLVIYTSGSSGRPKAALQSVEALLHKYLRPGRRLRTLGFLLFDHIAGVDTLLYTLANGGTLVVTRERDPAAVSELIQRANVEVLPASPSFLRLLCLTGGATSQSLPSLRVITYGSEPMDSSTLQRLHQNFPGVRIVQKYGTTETGAPRSESRGDQSTWLRFKRDGLECKVVDGVLWLRGAGLILGYLNAETLVDSDGWYCTGDLVEVDGEWLRIRGRGTEQINVGGEKVAPPEVEAVILGLEFVKQVAVTGEAHPLLGQIVTARVELSPGIDPGEAVKQIRQQCRAQLARHKIPVKIECVTDPLVTSRQKLQRLPSDRLERDRNGEQ